MLHIQGNPDSSDRIVRTRRQNGRRMSRIGIPEQFRIVTIIRILGDRLNFSFSDRKRAFFASMRDGLIENYVSVQANGKVRCTAIHDHSQLSAMDQR